MTMFSTLQRIRATSHTLDDNLVNEIRPFHRRVPYIVVEAADRKSKTSE